MTADPGPGEAGATQALSYLVGLDLAGRRVVVVGGGNLAQRRLPALIAAGADLHIVSPILTPTIEGLMPADNLTWHARDYADGDLDGAWYALALTDRPEVNRAVTAEADRRRVFCVRSDRARDGSARTPATAHDGTVQLAVLGGDDPRRAAAVRDQLAESMRRGRLDLRARRVAADGTLPGVAIVGGGPGDPDLITVRGRSLLARADVVVADRLAPQSLLDDLATDVEVVDAAKLPRGRAMAQQAINDVLIDRALAGRFVVRLKGGDPYVFGRGGEEVQACLAAGVPVRLVPGVTSALSVPALAGIPLTHRGLAHEAVIVSGHLSPDDPATLVDWPSLARLRGTLLVLMGVDRLPEIASVLLRHGRPADTPAAVVLDGSLPGQRVVRAELGDIVAVAHRENVRPPAVIVIGQVAGLDLSGD